MASDGQGQLRPALGSRGYPFLDQVEGVKLEMCLNHLVAASSFSWDHKSVPELSVLEHPERS